MQLGTFTAHIIVDGNALEEHDIVSESPTKVTCWVASEEGKAFGVKWKCHEQLRVVSAQGLVTVDGIGCGGFMTFPGLLGSSDTCILSHAVEYTATRDLMFARIQLSDDESLLNKEIHKNLGEISLKIKRGNVVKKRLFPDEQVRFVPGNNEVLHERSKKATVHCVGFGPERPRDRPLHTWHVIYNDQPEISFVFKYRPLSVLQANGIAPRPTSTDTNASHENNSSEHDIGTSDGPPFEDIKPAELTTRIRSLENELKRLRELQDNNTEDRKPKRIKTEDHREQKRSLFVPGEIIDLT